MHHTGPDASKHEFGVLLLCSTQKKNCGAKPNFSHAICKKKGKEKDVDILILFTCDLSRSLRKRQRQYLLFFSFSYITNNKY